MLFLLIGLAISCDKVTIRKEVNDMTEKDWKTFSDTIKLATKTVFPGSNLNIWEHYASVHASLYKNVHGVCSFYPWHRVMLRDFEQRMQEFNPDFFFPYWREDLDYNNPEGATLWKYIGTTGTPVSGSPLDGYEFKSPYNVAGPYLSREFTWKSLNLPSAEIYGKIFENAANGFKDWHAPTSYYHGYLHDRLGYQMKSHASPEDPLFYIHHSFIDYLWDKAQGNWALLDLDQYDALDGCGPEDSLYPYKNRIKDVMKVDSQLCYKYAQRGEIAKPNITKSKTETDRVPETLSTTISTYPRPSLYSSSTDFTLEPTSSTSSVLDIVSYPTLSIPTASRSRKTLVHSSTSYTFDSPLPTSLPNKDLGSDKSNNLPDCAGKNYEPMTSCPDRLSDDWLANSPDPDKMRKLMEDSLELCKRVLNETGKEKRPTYMPFADYHERPQKGENKTTISTDKIIPYTSGSIMYNVWIAFAVILAVF